MATKQGNIKQGIAKAVVEVARVKIQAMVVARTDNNDRMYNVMSKIGEPLMQQPTFNWEAEDKYSKLKNFIQEVNNNFDLTT